MTTAQSSATAPPRSANPPATFATADDWEFSREILPQVSRTFALSISALPERLSRAVGTAYLMCRIVDTIEDDAKLDPAARDRAFFAFDQLLIDDKTASSPLLDIVLEHRIGGDSPDHRLCGRADAVFRCFRALSLDQRAAIRPHVLEMSRGMREFTERADRLGELRLADMAEVERYCYFVAGTVGKLLTALFELEVPQLSPQLCSQLRARAVSFGLALQLVNILKDVAEDHRRGDCFLPAEWALEEGVELDELLAPEHREAALAVVARVAARAREHLRRAEAYTLLWPTEDASARAVRLFCAVPLTLALATLDQIESGDDTLRHDRKPKVSRELVADVFRRAQSGARDDRVLGALFAAHGGASLAPSGSSSTVAKLAQSAGEGGPRLRRFRGRALVTGATGHLGANLVRRLLDEGVAVRALILAGTDTEALDELADVELVYGDLRQPATLAAAVAGCETVYHTAALVSTLQGDATHKRDVFETNVLGTRHLLRAADAAGVKRVVVTGSFGANGYHRPDSTR
ncbi:MAG: squalene/phytoene synthase family protein, partial [Myxococcota bacterium]